MTDSLNNLDLPIEAGASRKTLWLVVAVGLVLVGAVVWFRLNVATSTPPEARAAASAFLHAVANGDFDTAAKMVDASVVDLAYLEREAKGFGGNGGLKSESALIGRSRGSQSNTPMADFSQELHFNNFMRTFSVTVKKIEGAWKITSFTDS